VYRRDARLPEWHEPEKLEGRSYQCGFCGREVASEKGYWGNYEYHLYLCPRCLLPTLFDPLGRQLPAPPYGEQVEHLPKEIEGLYQQARECMTVGAYTPAVMGCRKLLMNVAVNKGAAAGLSYKEYVEYLAAKNYVPPDGKGWVDHIRDKGNDANHEIPDMTRDDARQLIDFTGMLLKLVYEYPARVPGTPGREEGRRG
jgi:Domain of unknown function (DUF4145)